MKSSKNKLQNEEYAEAIGKTTFLKLEWKSWDEPPKSGSNIYVILKGDDGYVPVYGEYLDYQLDPVPGDVGRKPHMFREVRFPGSMLNELYIGSEEAKKHLYAWAYALLVVKGKPFADKP